MMSSRPGNRVTARLLTRIMLLGAGFCFVSVSALADVTVTDDDLRSVVNINQLSNRVRGAVEACSSFLGDAGYAFKFFEYFWSFDNLAVSEAADSAWGAIPDKRKGEIRGKLATESSSYISEFNARDRAEKRAFCSGVINRMASKGLNFSNALPNDSEQLVSKFKKSTYDRSAKRNADLAIGCVKGVYNNGGKSLDSAKRFCDCQTRSILHYASDKEIDDWLNGLSSDTKFNERNLLNKTWYKKASDSLASCVLK